MVSMARCQRVDRSSILRWRSYSIVILLLLFLFFCYSFAHHCFVIIFRFLYLFLCQLTGNRAWVCWKEKKRNKNERSTKQTRVTASKPKKIIYSTAGNRTPVPRVTGEDTSHYTTTEWDEDWRWISWTQNVIEISRRIFDFWRIKNTRMFLWRLCICFNVKIIFEVYFNTVHSFCSRKFTGQLVLRRQLIFLVSIGG